MPMHLKNSIDVRLMIVELTPLEWDDRFATNF